MPNARRSHKVNLIEEEIIPLAEAPKESETVTVRLMKTLIVKVIGGATGKEYIFNGAGSVVNVDKSDLESIMRKNKIHQSCCGTYSSPYFEIL